MSFDKDLRLKHERLQIEKRKRRWRYLRNIVLTFVLVVLSYLGFTSPGVNSGVVTFFVLTFVGSFIVFLILTVSTVEGIWSPLRPVEKAFEAVYEALSKTWPTLDETRELSSDEKFMKDYVRDLLDEASQRFADEGSARVLDDEIRDLFERTQ